MQSPLLAQIFQSPDTGGGNLTAATVTAMSAITGLTANSLVYLTDNLRDGIYMVQLGNYAAAITDDPTWSGTREHPRDG